MSAQESSVYQDVLVDNCLEQYADMENELANTGEPYCGAMYACFMCWPPVVANSMATASCPVQIDTTFELHAGSAELYCGPGGNWTTRSNEECVDILLSGDVCKCSHCDALKYIMVAGYSVSLVALIVAFCMIVGIRALRVMRNKIHANLLASFIFSYTVSLITHIVYIYNDKTPPLCRVLILLISYFLLSNFCWMSLEGFYLYALVVLAFRVEPDNIKMWKYGLVGWGPAAILTACQAIAFTVQTPKISADVDVDNSTASYAMYTGSTSYNSYEVEEEVAPDCWFPDEAPWQMYAFVVAPVLLLLAMNVFFLAMILRVLLPKIRSTGTNNVRSHLKMLKSAIVLVVLLGTVYIVFLIEPHIKNVTPLTKYIMTVINTTLQCTQGLAVAILYVFMNSDVQTKVSNEARRFSDRRLSSIKGLSMRQNGNTPVRRI